MPERAVIYMRKSRDEEGNGVYSFEYQERDCRTFAANQGYRVVDALIEPEETGHDSLNERRLLGEVRRMVRAREVEVVLVWRYDRLARDFLDQAVFIREANDYNVRVESATEPVPDGPLGWMMQLMIGGMSEQEWHATRQRLQAGIKRRVEKGLYLPGNRAPY